MNLLLETEFQELITEFRNELKNYKIKSASFSLLGSPLIETDFLIAGNNWGGNQDIKPQKNMPLVNDILAEPNNPTYRGYIDFFSLLFDSEMSKTVDFLNRAVYTNGSFLRTPNEQKDYQETLNIGCEISPRYLKKILDLTKARIIICFGNSERSATSSLVKSLNITGEFWKIEGIKRYATENNWSTYKLCHSESGIDYELYSFPHSSKFHQWSKGIGKNAIFTNLKANINK